MTPTPIAIGNFAFVLCDICSTVYIGLVTTLELTSNLEP